MKFSLVMATLGRSEEIALFIKSLEAQTYKDFELFIVDQNDDDRVEKALGNCPLNITLIKSNVKGLSVNRNVGLKYISGDIVAFPDDDCEYEPDTLERVIDFFNNNPAYGFYTCNTKEKNSASSVLKTLKNDADISPYNLLDCGISFTIFTRRNDCSNFAFDKKLGVGAQFGSGEESDLLLWLLKNKKRGRYHANHYIYHPGKTENIERVYNYSLGYGALFKKAVTAYHFYPLFFVFIYKLLRNLAKFCLNPRNKTTQSFIKGRVSGFISYHP